MIPQQAAGLAQSLVLTAGRRRDATTAERVLRAMRLPVPVDAAMLVGIIFARLSLVLQPHDLLAKLLILEKEFSYQPLQPQVFFMNIHHAAFPVERSRPFRSFDSASTIAVRLNGVHGLLPLF